MTPPPPSAPLDFRMLFEAMPGLFLVAAVDAPRFTIVAVSDAYARQTMKRRDEIVGQALVDVVHDTAGMSASLARVMATGVSDTLPVEQLGGIEERWWRPVNAPLFGANGELAYILHRIDDVSELVRLNAASVEARSQAVAHVGSWWLDTVNNTRRWSDELYRIFGIEKGGELTRREILDRTHPEDRARVEMASLATAHGEAVDIQYRIVVHGETRWVRARSEPEPDALGRRVGTIQDITDQKRVEQQLAEKSTLLNAIFENASDGIFVADGNGNYVDVNPSGCRMLGYTREELVRLNIKDIVEPAELLRQAKLVRHLQQGGAEVSEWRLRRKDGTYLPAELSSNALPDGRLQAFVRDVTARLEAAEKLRFSEAKYAGIVAISADAIISIDEEQRITLFNEGAQKMFGYTSDELIGQPIHVLLPERFHARHRNHVSAFAAGDSEPRRMGQRNASIVGRRKNGEEFPADAAIAKVDVAHNTILTVTVRDVTEQKRAEQEQRFFAEVGAQLAMTLDSDQTARNIARLALELGDWCIIRVFDDAGHARTIAVLSADPAKQAAADALCAFPVNRDRPHLGHRAMAQKAVVLVEVQSPAELQALTQGPDHLRLLEELGVSSIMEAPLIAHGRLFGALVVVATSPRRRFSPADLRLIDGLAHGAALALENARLYSARQAAVEARDALLGVVAHDLRSPLSVILLSMQRLRSGAESHASTAKTTDVVFRAATRMNQLIRDLLDVTRAEAGGLPLERTHVAPKQLLADVTDAHAVLAAEAGIELTLDAVADDLPPVWGDSRRLLQVFENLVGNALKFTPRGGRIHLGANVERGEVLFYVEDTGPGIPANELPYVFDRFWQAKRSNRAGAGLGLAIAKGVVESHGGRISVESIAGQGSIFRFTVPVHPPSVSPRPEDEHPGP